MTIVHRILRKISGIYRRRSFELVTRGILDTPPLEMDASGPLFVSMVCHTDVERYLLALKSIYRHIRAGAALVIDDGTLDDGDRATIARHVPLCSFVPVSTIDTGPCPQGGTWERLLYAIDLTRTNYVIQIDSDTLTQAPVPEVIEAWRANRSWTLGTDVGQTLRPASEVAAMVRSWPQQPPTIGMIAEMTIGEEPHLAMTKYIHGSSGFAGFARGAHDRGLLYTFSRQMQAHLGVRWSEWGTEQIASNWAIANAPDAAVLPFDRYASFEPWVDPHTRAFLHFIGTYRYDRGIYAAMARKVIAALHVRGKPGSPG
jgi:hypothetical protein